MSSTILLVMAPEMASLRTAISALEIYDRLAIPMDKVKIVLNNNSFQPGHQAGAARKSSQTPDRFCPSPMKPEK